MSDPNQPPPYDPSRPPPQDPNQPPAQDPNQPPAYQPYPGSETPPQDPYPSAQPPPYQPYPQFPGDSGGGYAAYGVGGVTGMEQPQSLKTAVRLMIAGAAVSILSLIIALATISTLKDDVRDRLRDTNPTFSDQDFDTTWHVTIATIVIISLIGALLWVWMAWKNGQGRKWARVVATVFGALNIASFLFGLAGGTQAGITSLFGAINVAIGGAALYFMYRAESTAYYNARSGRH